jgi:two-component system response regulator PilR (NtrC family)
VDVAEVLVVDDEPSIREFLEIMLRRAGHEVRLAQDAPEAIVRLKQASPDLVLTDLKLPRGTGMDVLQHVSEHHADTEVIMMTAFATTENAIEAMKLGAYDYVLKPFKVDELSVVIERALAHRALQAENKQLKEALDARVGGSRLIGNSPAMKEVFALIGKVAPTRTTVLITGESGTGKELVSRAIHSRGPREKEPFVPINCGAIPETLIESELFGHVKGAFTGAQSDKPGLFEAAGAGTVFLDEVGELPLQMQVKLLRVLQERKVRRVGGTTDAAVECRVIAATNRNLEEEVAAGRFREDLFFRLNVIQLRMPSLRERRADIAYLADAFVAKFAEEQASPVTRITDAAMQRLVGWDWPGNVRELENVIERGVTLASDDKLDVDVLPPPMRDGDGQAGVAVEVGALTEIPEEGLDLEATLEGVERHLLSLALERTGGRKKKAAELLGLSFRSFRYRVAKLGLGSGDDASAEGEPEA